MKRFLVSVICGVVLFAVRYATIVAVSDDFKTEPQQK